MSTLAEDASREDTSSARRAFRIGNAASVLHTAGASLTWAGLPVYAAHVTGDPRMLVWLFIAQTAAGVTVSLVAGGLADRYPARHLITATSAVMVSVLLATFFLLEPDRVWPYFALGLIMAACSSITSVAVRVWFTSLAPKDRIAEWTGRRGAWIGGAKLLGTSAGPVVFTALGSAGLLIEAGTVGASLVLYAIATAHDPVRSRRVPPRSGPRRQPAEGWRTVMVEPVVRHLLLLMVCASLLAMPLTAVCLRLLEDMEAVTSVHFSAFWAIGFLANMGVSALIGFGLTRRFRPSQVVLVSFMAAAALLLLLIRAPHPLTFLALFTLVVAVRTTLNITLFAMLIPAVGEEFRGRLVGISDFATGGAAFAALMVLGLAPTTALPAIVTAYLILVASSGLVVLKLRGATARSDTAKDGSR